MNKKLLHYGFNLYKNSVFQFLIQTDDESVALEQINHYLRVNKFDPKLYTYREFRNCSTKGFELKFIKNESLDEILLSKALEKAGEYHKQTELVLGMIKQLRVHPKMSVDMLTHNALIDCTPL